MQTSGPAVGRHIFEGVVLQNLGHLHRLSSMKRIESIFLLKDSGSCSVTATREFGKKKRLL